VGAALTPSLGRPKSAFVVVDKPSPLPEELLDAGLHWELEGLPEDCTQALEDTELVKELLKEAQSIRSSSGVGSPEIAKHVQAWQPMPEPSSTKASLLRPLALQLYSRRPLLYLRGQPDPLPASVLLRSARKPTMSALTRTVGPASLFKAPDNTLIVIKFDPRFGFADILVDPFFLDAFQQQPSTPTYDKLLASLPRAFVGTAPELKQLVALLTAQSIRAYAHNGTSVPPWRRFDAMVARWLPKSFTDEEVTQAHLEAAAAGSWPAHGSTRGPSGTAGGTSAAAPPQVVYGFNLPAKQQQEQPAVEVDAAPVAAAVEAVAHKSVAAQAVVPEAVAAEAETVAAEPQQDEEDVAAGSLDGQEESEPLSELFDDLEESTDTVESSDLDSEPAGAPVIGPKQPAAVAVGATSTAVLAAVAAAAAPGGAPTFAADPGPAGDDGEGLPSAAAAAAAAAAADYTAIKAAVLVAASKEADGWIEGYRKVCKPTYIADGGRGSSGGRSRQQGITAGSSAAAHDTRVALALHQRVCQPSDDPTAAATLPSMSSTSNSSTISVSTSSGSSDPGLTSKLSPGCTISAGKVLRRASAVHGPAAAAVGSICVVKLSGPAAAGSACCSVLPVPCPGPDLRPPSCC